jgi:hypothetical protein
MRLVAVRVLLLLSMAFLLRACASQSEVSSASSSSQTEGTVPGEKVSEEMQLAPAAGTRPGATTRW